MGSRAEFLLFGRYDALKDSRSGRGSDERVWKGGTGVVKLLVPVE